MSRIPMLSLVLAATACTTTPADDVGLTLAPAEDGHLVGQWTDGTTTITLEAQSFVAEQSETGIEVDGRLVDQTGTTISVQGSPEHTPAWLDAAGSAHELDADQIAAHNAALAALPALVHALDATADRSAETQLLLDLARNAADHASAPAPEANTTPYGNYAIWSWVSCPRPTWASEVMVVRACNTGSAYTRSNQWNWYSNNSWFAATTVSISPGNCASRSARTYGSDLTVDNNVSSTMYAFSFATDNYCSKL